MQALYKACQVPDKAYHVIQGANHYYTGVGMTEKLEESINIVVRWMHNRGLVDIAAPSLTSSDPRPDQVIPSPISDLQQPRIVGINHLALVCFAIVLTE